ncbi:MAG TPA: TonB family protein [Bryobacteraceae bacterium]|jgi:protein TonB|nr:TonB family protein [Bryobacteraceae bacterium]
MQTIDQREPLGRAFAGSILTHAGIVGLFVVSGFLHLTDRFGSPTASSGSVGVSMVKTIPIPRHEGPTNPLANDTKNVAPQEPSPAKPKPEVKIPEPDAIPIARKPEKQKKPAPKQQATNVFKPQEYQSNQVYSSRPQAANSPMYGMQGSGGIDIGPASVLGNRFGAYVQLMRDRIAQHWNTADVHTTPSQKCAVTFTIARNGSVSNVQVSQPSGNYLLDTSAKRAILDSNPLPQLPPQFPRSEATVELWFQLQK